MPNEFQRIEPTFGEGPIQPPLRDIASAQAAPVRGGTSSGISKGKVPLSRAPGKKKLIVGVPLALVSGAAYFAGLGSLAQMFFVAFSAYAVVGMLEVVLGSSLVRASESWTGLAWWQRGLASAIVVLVALGLVVTVIPALLG
jgi:hypothetical protein